MKVQRWRGNMREGNTQTLWWATGESIREKAGKPDWTPLQPTLAATTFGTSGVRKAWCCYQDPSIKSSSKDEETHVWPHSVRLHVQSSRATVFAKTRSLFWLLSLFQRTNTGVGLTDRSLSALMGGDVPPSQRITIIFRPSSGWPGHRPDTEQTS